MTMAGGTRMLMELIQSISGKRLVRIGIILMKMDT